MNQNMGSFQLGGQEDFQSLILFSLHIYHGIKEE
jgi:hypothetical protein